MEGTVLFGTKPQKVKPPPCVMAHCSTFCTAACPNTLHCSASTTNPQDPYPKNQLHSKRPLSKALPGATTY
eukprot:3661601-Amphidinium_carterae.2